MPKPVKLAVDIMNAARKEAVLHGRSVTEQIANWIKIGRTIESSPTFDFQRISVALAGGLSPDDLTTAEQEVWFDQFATMMAGPSKQERDSYVQLQKRGRGVGMSSSGDTVHERREG